MATDLVEWKRARLHPDWHVVFGRAYYSAPLALIGQQLWLRATPCVVQIFHEHRLVATHGRAYRPGQRVTNQAHLPPKKLRYLMQTPTWCRERAALIGPATPGFIERRLGDEVLDRLRRARHATPGGQLRRGAARAACQRAVACDAIAAKTVKHILQRGLGREPLPGDAVCMHLPSTRAPSSTCSTRPMRPPPKDR